MYSVDHYFIFSDFQKKILKIFITTNKNPNMEFVRLKDGWMLVQHWATSWCRRPSGEQKIGAVGNPHPSPIIAFPDRLTAAAIDVIICGYFDHAMFFVVVLFT